MMKITEEQLISFMDEKSYKPLTAQELVSALDIEDVEEFLKLLNSMEKKGAIVLTRKHRYGLPQRMGLIVGRLQGHSRGFGFVIPDNPMQQDVYVSINHMNGAMHNDRVMVRPTFSGKGQPEGEVIRILERNNREIVGTYEQGGNFGFVVPDDPRIYHDVFVPHGKSDKAQNGDKVVVEITQWPHKRRSPEGKIIEVIGRRDAPGVDIVSIIKKYRLPLEFPDPVLREAAAVPQSVSSEDLLGRRDLRKWRTVTIDGADAKDLDDAVSIEGRPDGTYVLGVHIADVSHYVRENSSLDREAFDRGTSVYLVDRVVPMLPPELSNGICSLNAGVDRLALSVVMNVSKNGSVLKYDIFPSVIRVDERMTYDNVRRILVDEDHVFIERYADYVKDFHLMEELCLILRDKRLRRGAIDFDFPEGKAILDEQGKPVDIVKRERSIAEQIIEEFMILANETVAEHMYHLELPFIYRVHEEPETESVSDLNNFLHLFGYHIKGSENGIHPKAFQEILELVKGRPEEKLISTMMLRSMKHANYDEICLGHFGLASKYYTHFTSPIRRYPDLAIHRVIKESLKGRISDKRLEVLSQRMPMSADQSSVREQVAEEAERECLDMKKAEYMGQHIGEVFTGVISSVLSFGFFVELPNTVEGLVHVSSLVDDYYTFWEKEMVLFGQHTKKMYRIGDEVKVQVVKVDVDQRQVDFEITEED
jgi:ribonuclease R